MTLPLRDRALAIVRRLRDSGHEAYFVGGCVRDRVMGIEPHDYDIATSATPEEIESAFRRTAAVGKAFGVILVLSGAHSFEVATFRSDGKYHDGRRPESVRFGTAREDALRRDFTINGMLYDPIADQVLDWVGGMRDIELRMVRAIGTPADRFAEDRLRMLRAVRFAARFGYAIEDYTRSSLTQLAAGLAEISWERIGQEIARILTGPNAGQAVRMMMDTGLLAVCLSEIQALAGVQQPPEFHPEGDVFEHTCLMLDAMRDPSPELALGVLLHDVGKPDTFSVSDRIRFNEHNSVGAEIARRVCRRLRYSNERTQRVSDLAHMHMRFMMVRRMKLSTLKRMMAAPHFDEHLELHRLDCLASHGNLANYDFIRDRLGELSQEEIAPEPLITGRDLIDMGYGPGPRFREILTAVRDAQLDGDLADRENAVDFVLRRFPLADEAGP